MGVTTPRIGFEEFAAMEDRPGKQELLDGEVIELPPAKRNHNVLSLWLFRFLDRLLAEKGDKAAAVELGDVCMEAGYRLSAERCVAPDVSVNHPRQPYRDYYERAPALAIEVVSEANTARHLEMKVRAYLEAGALEVWLVYPDSRSVWVHRYGADIAVRCQGSLTSDLLPGVAIDLNALFDASDNP